MPQQAKVLAIRPNDLRLALGPTEWKEETDSQPYASAHSLPPCPNTYKKVSKRKNILNEYAFVWGKEVTTTNFRFMYIFYISLASRAGKNCRGCFGHQGTDMLNVFRLFTFSDSCPTQ